MTLFIIPATHSALTGRWRLIDRTQELQRPIEYREVPERRNYDQTCPVASDQTLAASNQLFVAPMVGMTGCVRSGRLQRSVSSRKSGISSPTATFSVGLINTTPNRPNEVGGAKETYQGC